MLPALPSLSPHVWPLSSSHQQSVGLTVSAIFSHSLLHASLPPLGPWYPDRGCGWIWGQALFGRSVGGRGGGTFTGSAWVHHLAGGHRRRGGLTLLIGPWELSQLSVCPKSAILVLNSQTAPNLLCPDQEHPYILTGKQFDLWPFGPCGH